MQPSDVQAIAAPYTIVWESRGAPDVVFQTSDATIIGVLKQIKLASEVIHQIEPALRKNRIEFESLTACINELEGRVDWPLPEEELAAIKKQLDAAIQRRRVVAGFSVRIIKNQEARAVHYFSGMVALLASDGVPEELKESIVGTLRYIGRERIPEEFWNQASTLRPELETHNIEHP